jgi:quinol monooxygenase YgiN
MAINLTVILKSKPERRETLKTLLLALVQNSTKEAACLQYDLHQSVEDPEVFIFHEVWESEAGLKLHNEKSYLISFFENSKILLQEPVIIYRTEKLAQ